MIVMRDYTVEIMLLQGRNSDEAAAAGKVSLHLLILARLGLQVTKLGK